MYVSVKNASTLGRWLEWPKFFCHALIAISYWLNG